MGKMDNRADVEPLKKMLQDGWNRILRKVPDEKVYAFGIYTNECAQSMSPFLLGEKGLQREAAGSKFTTEDLRWSTADSPYCRLLFEQSYSFEARPDVFSLPAVGMEREVRYRLTAATTALKELEAEGLFGTGKDRGSITLYIEGGDVDREWLLKWAKKLNPPAVYERFAKIGQPDDTAGTFTEFGTKKVYETKQYALSADRNLIVAATEYQLFGFDTKLPKQMFGKALPDKKEYVSLGGVAMSDDGRIMAVIPFGGGKRGKCFFIVRGKSGEVVQTVGLSLAPISVAVEPAGAWIAVTDYSGAVNVFNSGGTLLGTYSSHADWPRGIGVSRDGRTLATADAKSLILWDTGSWSRRQTLTLDVDDLDFDPTGRFLVACRQFQRDGGPRVARIVDASTGSVARQVEVERYRIEHARFSPTGRYLACAMRADCEGYSGTNVSALVEVETGREVDRLKADFEQVRDFAFLPHRREIAVAVFGHTRRPLVLWKPKGWEGD